MMSCPSQWTEISACACSVCCDLARLGELTRLKLFTWEKVGHHVSPTEWPYPQGHPTPRARFAVSHINGRRWFTSNCRKTWLALVGLGWWEGGRVPRVPGPTFLHINRHSKKFFMFKIPDETLGLVLEMNFFQLWYLVYSSGQGNPCFLSTT